VKKVQSSGKRQHLAGLLNDVRRSLLEEMRNESSKNNSKACTAEKLVSRFLVLGNEVMASLESDNKYK
jgi:hypothetical protein